MSFGSAWLVVEAFPAKPPHLRSSLQSPLLTRRALATDNNRTWSLAYCRLLSLLSGNKIPRHRPLSSDTHPLLRNWGPYLGVRVVSNCRLGWLRTHSDCDVLEAVLHPFTPGVRKPNSHSPLLCRSVALSWKKTKTNVMTENEEVRFTVLRWGWKARACSALVGMGRVQRLAHHNP